MEVFLWGGPNLVTARTLTKHRTFGWHIGQIPGIRHNYGDHDVQDCLHKLVQERTQANNVREQEKQSAI